MTMQRDDVRQLFGLAGTFPRPGWVVLDAARDHRFTGELVFETSPQARVYLDRGAIYLAERIGDASLGARLVDAGALTAVQLERGAVRIGEIEHLGRLFERVPSLDRHTVIVTAELMTEECVRWLAAQRVGDVRSTPYRHHESAMHHWIRTPGWVELAPGDPLPAPPLDEPPVSVAPPGEPGPIRELQSEPFLDGLIEWDEPAWFDHSQLERELLEPLTGSEGEVVAFDDVGGADGREGRLDDVTGPVAEPPTGPETDRDWVDRLEHDGLPADEGLDSIASLPRLPIEPVERFELVWPTGEIDEEFGAVESVIGNGHDPDADRIGATARLARMTPDAVPAPPETSPPLDDERVAPTTADDERGSDEVVLAVRRAVASIEVGSLAARQRLADATPARGRLADLDDAGVPEPGRVAVRSGRNDWSRRTIARSVFDEPVVDAGPPERSPDPSSNDQGDRRAGALRRLISSLRR